MNIYLINCKKKTFDQLFHLRTNMCVEREKKAKLIMRVYYCYAIYNNIYTILHVILFDLILNINFIDHLSIFLFSDSLENQRQNFQAMFFTSLLNRRRSLRGTIYRTKETTVTAECWLFVRGPTDMQSTAMVKQTIIT